VDQRQLDSLMDGRLRDKPVIDNYKYLLVHGINTLINVKK
jgi:hypothetical protein